MGRRLRAQERMRLRISHLAHMADRYRMPAWPVMLYYRHSAHDGYRRALSSYVFPLRYNRVSSIV